MHITMIMYHDKGLFGLPSLIYLQCRFAICFDISLLPPCANYARSVLFAKANIGFPLFAAGLGPRACGPVVEHEIPIPVFTQSSMFAKAGISAPIAKIISITNAWYKGKVRFQQSNKYAF